MLSQVIMFWVWVYDKLPHCCQSSTNTSLAVLNVAWMKGKQCLQGHAKKGSSLCFLHPCNSYFFNWNSTCAKVAKKLQLQTNQNFFDASNALFALHCSLKTGFLGLDLQLGQLNSNKMIKAVLFVLSKIGLILISHHDILAKCNGQFSQWWFCSMRRFCITHPRHRTETK